MRAAGLRTTGGSSAAPVRACPCSNLLLLCPPSSTSASQDGWHGKGRKGPLGHPLQPLLQQGYPQQGVQDHVQVAFEDLQRGDSTTNLGNLCHWVIHTVKECFLMFRWNLLCFSLCPSPLAQSEFISWPASSWSLSFMLLLLNHAHSPSAPEEGQALMWWSYKAVTDKILPGWNISPG